MLSRAWWPAAAAVNPCLFKGMAIQISIQMRLTPQRPRTGFAATVLTSTRASNFRVKPDLRGRTNSSPLRFAAPMRRDLVGGAHVVIRQLEHMSVDGDRCHSRD